MAKATKIFMELKRTTTRVTTRPRNALNAESVILYSPERSAPNMDLYEVAEDSTGLPLQRTKVEHQEGKGTEKTPGRVITPAVKIDATDEHPQVKNVEMEIEENGVISLKQLRLNQSQFILLFLKLNLQTRYL